jgi:cytochrome P450
MHSFCWNVLSKPNVHEKLVAELHSSQLSEIVQYSEGISLPYFQACLKEAMRLQPAVGFNILRIMPNNSGDIDGVRVPAGTKIAVNAWVMHRNKEVFGDDADCFRPERWLECDNKNLKTMERYMFQVR